jgi:hypothetical protein
LWGERGVLFWENVREAAALPMVLLRIYGIIVALMFM